MLTDVTWCGIASKSEAQISPDADPNTEPPTGHKADLAQAFVLRTALCCSYYTAVACSAHGNAGMHTELCIAMEQC